MKSPTVLKTIEADYTAWLCVVVPIVLWAFYLFLHFTGVGGPNTSTLLFPCVLITLAGIAGLALRHAAIRAHFARAVEVDGQIVRYLHLQDLGRVIYKYTYLSKEFQTTNYIHHSTRTMGIEAMSAVKVLLDPARPRSALIKDLYLPQLPLDE